MNKGPGEPGREPCQSYVARFHDGEILADDGHVALVEVPKRARRPSTAELSRDQSSDITALLDCDLRYAWQRLAVLHQRRRIADHEYIRSIRNAQERADAGSPRTVGRDAQHLHEGRGRNARGPQDGAARDQLSANSDASSVDAF